MGKHRPLRLLAIGSGLVLAGWLLPFLMVLRVIDASFALSFLSYAALLSGTVLGVVGALQYRSLRDGEDG